MLVSLIGYIAFFAFSQGAVIWVYISRDLPQPRPGARAGARQLHPLVLGRRGELDVPDRRRGHRRAGVRVFRRDDAAAVRARVRFLPETKGVSLEQIQRTLGIE